MKAEKNRTEYTTPTLKAYGDVREITRVAGNKSANDDGGMGATDKTQ